MWQVGPYFVELLISHDGGGPHLSRIYSRTRRCSCPPTPWSCSGVSPSLFVYDASCLLAKVELDSCSDVPGLGQHPLLWASLQPQHVRIRLQGATVYCLRWKRNSKSDRRIRHKGHDLPTRSPVFNLGFGDPSGGLRSRATNPVEPVVAARCLDEDQE